MVECIYMKKYIIAVLTLIALSAAISGGFFYFQTDALMKNETPPGVIPSAENKSNLIKVSNINVGDIVESPVLIKGEARGIWYFEGSFPVCVTDSAGVELGCTPATAKGEWMTENFVPFEGVAIFKQPTTTAGFIILKKDNPSDLPKFDDQLKISVKFK